MSEEHSMLKKNKSAVIAAVFLVIGIIIGFSFHTPQGSRALSTLPVVNNFVLDSTPPENVDLTSFWKAWNVLDAKFVEKNSSSTPPTTEEKVFGAIQGLANSYGDPYTVFFPPKEAALFNSDITGNFEGVGMEIGVRDNVLTVIAPLKDTPAYRAGILSGDKIVAIDGKSTEGISADEAVSRIRGKKGSTVVFDIVRDGELIKIPVVRDVIEIPTVNTILRDDGVFVIQVFSFTSSSADLFRTALAEFEKSSADKLIIDLRGNPGGFLEAAVNMASWFVPEGEVIVTEANGRNGKDVVHRSRGYTLAKKPKKIAVLIDGGSASASEIFAGALQDYGLATLVGTQSFGKGSVQELVPITPKTSLKVTVARWLTPKGRSISGNGLTPDVEVMFNRDTDKDEQLEAAAGILKGT